jgi:hypothetical protein
MVFDARNSPFVLADIFGRFRSRCSLGSIELIIALFNRSTPLGSPCALLHRSFVALGSRNSTRCRDTAFRLSPQSELATR